MDGESERVNRFAWIVAVGAILAVSAAHNLVRGQNRRIRPAVLQQDEFDGMGTLFQRPAELTLLVAAGDKPQQAADQQ